MHVFNGNFTVQVVNEKGQQFDNISRIKATNEHAELVLDINSQIYQLNPHDRFALSLAHTLSLNSQGTKDTHWHPSELQATDATNYEYVMCGKVYRYEEDVSLHKATVYVSFGGLLMSLKGEQKDIKPIPGSGRDYIYLMIRKL